MPLPCSRAVLFASLVDDPSSDPAFAGQSETMQNHERERLFGIIRSLLQKKVREDPEVFERAHAEIIRSCDGNPPSVFDPFCGGGAIPLEAQRLGLRTYCGDLNPVAVLISKALIEIVPKFAHYTPVNPEDRSNKLITHDWTRACGLAANVRFYSRWMSDEARSRFGHLYTKVKLPRAYGGGEEAVVAWLWARTVKCPNPACGARMPLMRSFWLSTKKGNKTWLEPSVNRDEKTARFEIRSGEVGADLAQKIGAGTAITSERGKKIKATFRCLFCDVGVAKGKYIDAEANSAQM